LQNKYMSVKIQLKGAELGSLKDQNGKEFIWQARKPWKNHAPILFPIIGKLKDKTYYYKEKAYRMKNHGFISKRIFKTRKKEPKKVVLSFQSDEKTKEIYPFDFNLTATYQLKCHKLNIHYTVYNTGKDTMYFSIGSHPGFNLNLYPGDRMEDYYLQFQKKEQADRLLLEPKTRLVSRQIRKNFLNNTDTLSLNHQMFAKRVIILQSLQSKYVRIKNRHHSGYIEVGIKHFPFVGLWSPQEKAALLCIEPWYGHSDYIDTTQQLPQKAGIIRLAPGDKFEMEYYIKLSQN